MKRLPLLLLLIASPAATQDTLRLPELQSAAVRQDPRLRQLELQEARTTLRLRDLAVQRLPQLSATAEASHQSEVAALPVRLAGAAVPVPPEDRVEAAIQASLLLYEGGVLEARREAERAQLAAARAEIASTLYPLRAEVSRAYFGALLFQERAREASALIEDLEARLAMVRSQVRAGTALPGDTAALRAEVLRAEQQRDELAAERRASLAVLEALTGREVDEGDVLSLPDLEGVLEAAPRELRAHPQYAVFAARREGLDRQAEVVRARTRPQASAFARVAYGRPGLEQFTDRLHEYWLAGIRVQWSPWDWGTSRREREALRIQREILDTEETAFAERVQRQLERPLETMERLRAALETDDRVVALREQVARQARVQFEERAITAAAYVDALTDLEAARVARLRHRVELAQARADYLNTLGVELR